MPLFDCHSPPTNGCRASPLSPSLCREDSQHSEASSACSPEGMTRLASLHRVRRISGVLASSHVHPSTHTCIKSSRNQPRAIRRGVQQQWDSQYAMGARRQLRVNDDTFAHPDSLTMKLSNIAVGQYGSCFFDSFRLVTVRSLAHGSAALEGFLPAARQGCIGRCTRRKNLVSRALRLANLMHLASVNCVH